MNRRTLSCLATQAAAALALLPLPLSVSAAPMAATITFVEGASTIVSGSSAFVPAAGVVLRACDFVRTGESGWLQFEYEDGGAVIVGPDSRFVVDPRGDGGSAVGPHFLLSGWAKLSVPKRANAPPYRIDAPRFDITLDAGAVALRVAADVGQFYVERGEATAQWSGANPVARAIVGAGRSFTREAGQEAGTVSEGVDPVFALTIPRVLRDSLPTLLARLQGRVVKPVPAPTAGDADAEAWLRRVPELRGCVADDAVRTAQKALARKGFDVGPIDGVLGPRTRAALQAFQQQAGLARSGRLDTETLDALGSAGDR